MKAILKMIGIILISPVFAFLLIFLLGWAAPYVFLMFFAMYFIIGPLLQLLVLKFPQLLVVPPKKYQPTPWGQLFGRSLTAVLRAGAILAVFRLLFHLAARWIIPEHEQGNVILRPEVDLFFGLCGLAYAFLSFVQEGLWQYRQVLAVRELATSTVGATAVGLVELSGVVRRKENRDGRIEPGHVVMHFYWQIQGTHRMGKTIMLGTYDKDMKPFYLDDGTGRILVDPMHEGVELRRPIGSVLTTFFGRRSFEILLTKDVRRPTWDQRHYYLREGDRVHVMGNAEMNEQAPRNAADADRLVVRPRHQARGFESILQHLVPSRKKPARTPHDIFIIADTSETEAKAILMKNFQWSVTFSLSLAIASVLLILFAGGH